MSSVVAQLGKCKCLFRTENLELSVYVNKQNNKLNGAPDGGMWWSLSVFFFLPMI